MNDTPESFWDLYELHLTQLEVKSIKSPFYSFCPPDAKTSQYIALLLTPLIQPLNWGNSNYIFCNIVLLRIVSKYRCGCTSKSTFSQPWGFLIEVYIHSFIMNVLFKPGAWLSLFNDANKLKQALEKKRRDCIAEITFWEEMLFMILLLYQSIVSHFWAKASHLLLLAATGGCSPVLHEPLHLAIFLISSYKWNYMKNTNIISVLAPADSVPTLSSW